MGGPARVLCIGTYELGHQPLHLASAAGALSAAGHEVRALDLAVDPLDPALLEWPDVVAIAVPMHTACALAGDAIRVLRSQRGPGVRVILFGLYAVHGAALLPAGAVDAAVAGETGDELVRLAGGAEPGAPKVVLDRVRVPIPRRDLLPPLDRYTRLRTGSAEVAVGQIEASRGCVHRCRHCPVPVIYDGRIRVSPLAVVRADARALHAAGARHLSLADPDAFNAVPHTLAVLRALHADMPEVTFDITVKVEHVLKHAGLWPEMRELGVILVVSAVETLSDRVLQILDKGHTATDVEAALRILRDASIEVRPSLLPFTPWTELTDHLALLDAVAAWDLEESVDPVHLGIRLLLPAGSLLLGEASLQPHIVRPDSAPVRYTPSPASLSALTPREHRWRHQDPAMDALQEETAALVAQAADTGEDPRTTHRRVRVLAGDFAARAAIPWRAEPPPVTMPNPIASGARPRLTEAWFCCAEPTPAQRRTAAPSIAGAG